MTLIPGLPASVTQEKFERALNEVRKTCSTCLPYRDVLPASQWIKLGYVPKKGTKAIMGRMFCRHQVTVRKESAPAPAPAPAPAAAPAPAPAPAPAAAEVTAQVTNAAPQAGNISAEQFAQLVAAVANALGLNITAPAPAPAPAPAAETQAKPETKPEAKAKAKAKPETKAEVSASVKGGAVKYRVTWKDVRPNAGGEHFLETSSASEFQKVLASLLKKKSVTDIKTEEVAG